MLITQKVSYQIFQWGLHLLSLSQYAKNYMAHVAWPFQLDWRRHDDSQGRWKVHIGKPMGIHRFCSVGWITPYIVLCNKVWDKNSRQVPSMPCPVNSARQTAHILSTSYHRAFLVCLGLKIVLKKKAWHEWPRVCLLLACRRVLFWYYLLLQENTSPRTPLLTCLAWPTAPEIHWTCKCWIIEVPGGNPYEHSSSPYAIVFVIGVISHSGSPAHTARYTLLKNQTVLKNTRRKSPSLKQAKLQTRYRLPGSAASLHLTYP